MFLPSCLAYSLGNTCGETRLELHSLFHPWGTLSTRTGGSSAAKPTAFASECLVPFRTPASTVPLLWKCSCVSSNLLAQALPPPLWDLCFELRGLFGPDLALHQSRTPTAHLPVPSCSHRSQRCLLPRQPDQVPAQLAPHMLPQVVHEEAGGTAPWGHGYTYDAPTSEKHPRCPKAVQEGL